jgi:hypothetical protein
MHKIEEKDNLFLDNIINSHFLFDIQNIYGGIKNKESY